MRYKRWLIWLLCILFLFSLLACEVSGQVIITVVVPTHAPPGLPLPTHDPPPGPSPSTPLPPDP
jgi:hypothetical protein